MEPRITPTTDYSDAAYCCDCGAADKPWNTTMRQGAGWVDGRIRACQSCARAIEQHNKATRKAELAAMPRCEVEGCRRRGTWRVGSGSVLMCGQHEKRAEAQHGRAMASVGGMGLFVPADYSREQLLAMAAR